MPQRGVPFGATGSNQAARSSSLAHSLEELISIAHRERIGYLRVGGIEIEFLPEPRAALSEPPHSHDADACDCGHSILVKHTEAGCLEGCSPETCARTGQPEAQA